MQFKYIFKQKVVAVFVFAFLSAWNAGTGHWIAEASHVRFLRHLRRWTTTATVSSPLSYRRDWTVNEPARRTNLRGDSPRASLLASLGIFLLSDWASESTRRARERKARVALPAERGLEWIRISRSSDGIVPRFLLLRLLLCSFLHSYTPTSERRLVSRSMPRKCPSRHIPRERSRSERIALKGRSWGDPWLSQSIINNVLYVKSFYYIVSRKDIRDWHLKHIMIAYLDKSAKFLR